MALHVDKNEKTVESKTDVVLTKKEQKKEDKRKRNQERFFRLAKAARCPVPKYLEAV